MVGLGMIAAIGFIVAGAVSGDGKVAAFGGMVLAASVALLVLEALQERRMAKGLMSSDGEASAVRIAVDRSILKLLSGSLSLLSWAMVGLSVLLLAGIFGIIDTSSVPTSR